MHSSPLQLLVLLFDSPSPLLLSVFFILLLLFYSPPFLLYHWHCSLCPFFIPFFLSFFLYSFLSFFHPFFLPVAWAVDLAVQGCKYHCVFFHSCPSTSTPLFTHLHMFCTFWVAGVSAAWQISLHLALPPPYIQLCAVRFLMRSTWFWKS